MVTLALSAIAGFAVPHALQLRHVNPPTAIVIWLAALSLRALTVVLTAALVLLEFPRECGHLSIGGVSRRKDGLSAQEKKSLSG
jgi:hypothetical protein